MFYKAIVLGQNLMAKDATMLTDAATEGTTDTTVEVVEEATNIFEKIADAVKTPAGITVLCALGVVVAAVVLWKLGIKPAIRKNQKSR